MDMVHICPDDQSIFLSPESHLLGTSGTMTSLIFEVHKYDLMLHLALNLWRLTEGVRLINLL